MAHCSGGSVILGVGRFHTLKILCPEEKAMQNTWKVFVLKVCVEEPLARTSCLVHGKSKVSCQDKLLTDFCL